MSRYTLQSSCRQVSLVVPTMNRPAFVLRLLRYLTAEDFDGEVLIGDSSDPVAAQQLQTAIAEYSGRLKIAYRYLPAMSEPEVSGRLLDLASTPYAVWLADDDLVVPSSVAQCVAFLDAHLEYSLAHGRSAMITLKQAGPYGSVEAVWPHYWQDLVGKTGADRLGEYLGPRYFAPLFSVHRTAQFRTAYHRASLTLLGDKVFMEPFVGCLAAIDGKAKRMECLYLIRQHHAQRYLISDFYAWLTTPQWSEAFGEFRRGLIEALAERDGVSREVAERIVKEAFWPWLAARVTSHWQRYRGSKTPQLYGWVSRGLRERLRRIPTLKRVWRWVRSMIPDPQGMLSLPALQHRGSPYHAAFMPVYHLLEESESQHADGSGSHQALQASSPLVAGGVGR